MISMEMISNTWNGSFNRKKWRRKGYNYTKLSTASTTTTKFGSSRKERRLWRIKINRKLRIKLSSPLKPWCKLKNVYMKLVLKLARNAGGSAGINHSLGSKRVPEARQISNGYSRSEFENRLIFEIYKNMVASYELGSSSNNR